MKSPIGSIAALTSPEFCMKPDSGGDFSGVGTSVMEPPQESPSLVNLLIIGHPIVETMDFEMKKLIIDAGTQPRVTTCDETINDYAEKIKEAIAAGQPNPFDLLPDEKLPQVFRDHTGRCVLADGFQRMAAHKIAKLTDFRVAIREGTEREALLFSCGTNSDHGAQRTIKDMVRAVKNLLSDPEWVQWSDSDIARACHVSPSMVASHRTVAQTPGARKFTKGGKTTTMDTSAIGKGKGGGKKGAKAAAKAAEPTKKAGRPKKSDTKIPKSTGSGDFNAENVGNENGAAAAAAPKVEPEKELDKQLMKIAMAVGGDEGGKIRRAVLDETLPLTPKQVREWSELAPRYIKSIAPLVTGGARMKPAAAFDFIHSELSAKVVTELHNRAIGNGGTFTHDGDGVKIVVTHTGK